MARKIATEAASVALLLVTGCRAVIGIDDLVRGDASVDGTVTSDAALPDAAGDASDAASDASPADAARTLADCNAFCRGDGGPSGGGAAFSTEMHSCICQGASFKACAAECPGYCPNGNPPSPACEVCILQQTADGGSCSTKAGTCTTTCKGFLQCVTTCL
jgi:hypothetical protein